MSPAAAYPGPAGAIDAFEKAPLDCDSPFFSQRRRSGGGCGGFQRTEAWIKLGELIGDAGAPPGAMQAAGRVTLEALRVEASQPPVTPARAPLLCVLIKSIDAEGGGGEDPGALLADESGEMAATLHTALFNEHPGSMVVGAAVALRTALSCLCRHGLTT